MRNTGRRLLTCAALLLGVAGVMTAASGDSELRDLVERYAVDRMALMRRYPVTQSPERFARLKRFYEEWQKTVDGTSIDGFGVEGRVDAVLLRQRLAYELVLLGREQRWQDESAALLPFGGTILTLNDARLRMETTNAEQAAATLSALVIEIDKTRRAVEAGLGGDKQPGASPGAGPGPQTNTGPQTNAGAQTSGGPQTNGGPRTNGHGDAKPAPLKATKLVAYRAQENLEDLTATLKAWYAFYAGYDPLFTWWAESPYKAAAKSLDDYRKLLRERVLGMRAGEDEPIVGTPIGRAALVSDLGSEFIAYTPEDLIAMGDREFAWCEAEMKKASREMGLGDNWLAAVEKVKTLHVEPGKQPDLIRDLAREAEDYVEKNQLITVPPLAKEVWRMQMMTPERQKVNPFFTGGEVISVSYPTSTMDQDDKLMSMRGNNIHFARATVFHELIPGHHLQGFMNARYNSHRGAFRTAFWSEGWSLYWEMLLWDRGFQRSPEDRVGMLFWRMHRAARILFSLRFHLGEWTPQQCIDFLVDRVGHERANAEAEVRRSFNGSYPPLYQLAYMMGGLQFKALHAELVERGGMSDRAFHDAIITGGPMPVEIVRARLTKQLLPKDYKAGWKYYGQGPIAAAAAAGAK